MLLVAFEGYHTRYLVVQVVGIAEFHAIDGVGNACHIEFAADGTFCIFDGFLVALYRVGIGTHGEDDGVVDDVGGVELHDADVAPCRRFSDVLVNEFLDDGLSLMLLSARGEQQQGYTYYYI